MRRIMRRFTLFDIMVISLAFLALVAIVVRNARAAPYRYTRSYPSVVQLQQVLNAYPGAQIPAKELVMNNHVWTAWYVGARALGSGRYAVIIQLR